LNSLNTELTVNGVQEQWLLEAGANLSVVSKSFAQRLGFTPLTGTAQTVSGITGIENPMQLSILPALEMGGATLHNVVLLIVEDANLKVSGGKHYDQINGIIGYPVFQAMGVISFLHDGWFEAGDSARPGAAVTRMYMKQLTPVIECGVEGMDLPFSFDWGASGTTLSKRREGNSEAGACTDFSRGHGLRPGRTLWKPGTRSAGRLRQLSPGFFRHDLSFG
jgi:Aspartyl protease